MKDANTTNQTSKKAVVFGQPKLSFARSAKQQRHDRYRQLVAGLRRKVCA